MIDHSCFAPKRVAYFTLGCKLNFAETSSIAQEITSLGFTKAQKGESADLCIINTCSVTELADKKCRQTIRRVARENPNAFIIVTGCYAQLKPEDIAHIPEVDLVLGAEQKKDIITYLNDLTKHAPQILTTESSSIEGFAPSCSRGDRTRYFLKVQDGCDYRCSYCTIPLARGKSRNGSIASLVEQATQAANQGAKEIIITGVNIGDFGKSTGETFIDLIKALDKVDGIVRYRISSIEPNLLTDEIIHFVATSQRFAPHFHIPLQSGSDDVLRLMHRRYLTSLFASKVTKIKEVMPDAFIGVDLIVGVRGETEAYFEDAYAFVQSLDISQLHVFTYSERPNTKALEIPHIVSSEEKNNRCQRMLQLSEKKLRTFYSSQQGKIRSTLVEEAPEGEQQFGFTDNYVRIAFDPHTTYTHNTILQVCIGSTYVGNDAVEGVVNN